MTLIGVVSYDQSLLELFDELLVHEGFQTLLCWGITDAEGRLQRTRPHLIIFDIGLCETERWHALLQSMHHDAATAHVPIIACSANLGFLKHNAALLREQHCHVVLKPFALDDLLTTIHTALHPTLLEQVV